MDRETLKRMQADPAEFRRVLKINAGGRIMPLAQALDPWQEADFRALDPAWRCVALQQPHPGTIRRSWQERPRGHSKTGDLAAQVAWVLFASKRRLTGNGAAADKQQAKLLRDAIAELVILNPWLGRFLDVQLHKVVNPRTRAELRILSSDAATAYGEKPDFIVCDEVTHWLGKGGAKFWDTMFSASAKLPWCLLSVITNAGLGMGSLWQWKAREYARKHPTRWFFSRLEGPVASWIGAGDLAEQRAMLPAEAFRRLWLNEWVQGTGDAIDPDDIAAAITRPGPMTVAEIRAARVPWAFAGGLDLGIKHDHSAISILGTQYGSGRIRLAACESWAPTKGNQVDVEAVEKSAIRLHEQFGLAGYWYDPSQAQYLAQRLRRRGIEMVEVSFVGKSADLMARDLMTSFRGRQIELYDDPRLIHDLHQLTIMQRRRGYALAAVADETGHADRAIAMAMPLPAMVEASYDDAPPLTDDADDTQSVRA